MNLKLYSSKRIALLLVFFSLVLFSYDTQAAFQTTLSPGVYIPNVDVGEYSAVTVYDWNSDGSKDLVIGSRTGIASTGYHGYVKLYQNVGADSSPLFSGSSDIQACTTACSAIDAIAAG